MQRNKLSGAAIGAIGLALVPFGFSRAVTTWEGPNGTRREESTRLLVVSNQSATEFYTGPTSVMTDPTMRRKHSDPVALGGGAAAAVVGGLGLALALRSRPRLVRSAAIAGAAVAMGGYHVLRGLGKI